MQQCEFNFLRHLVQRTFRLAVSNFRQILIYLSARDALQQCHTSTSTRHRVNLKFALKVTYILYLYLLQNTDDINLRKICSPLHTHELSKTRRTLLVTLTLE